jgi:CHASE2 domain-containing sensor protein
VKPRTDSRPPVLKRAAKRCCAVLVHSSKVAAHVLLDIMRSLGHSITRFLVSARSLAARARDRWHAVEHWKAHWIVNILIGIGIEFFLVLFSANSVVVGMKNWAMDAAMRGNAATETSVSQPAPPVTIIDIDEETWRSPAWGNGPYRAPRGPLLNLVRYATRAGARSVLVDVTIEAPNDSDDEMFKAGIQDLLPELKPEQHILFMKTARRPLFLTDQLAPAWQPSILDPVVSASRGKLAYAAPYFQVSTDGVVRSWLLWRAGCQPDRPDSSGNDTGLGHWTVIPSVQLAVLSLEHGGAIIKTSEKQGGICLISPEAIGKQPEAPLDSAWRRDVAQLFGNESDNRHDESDAHSATRFDPSSRIFYQERYPPQAAGVSVISALKVLQHDSHLPAISTGSIVVIGQSSEAARDWHSTPLGSMPGSMIIANALQSLFTFHPIREFSRYIEWPLNALLIIVVGLVFALADSWIGGMILIAFVPVLILMNLLLLRKGYWFEFSVPLLAMYLHRLISNFEEYMVYRKWRRIHAADHSTHQ